MGAAYRPNKVRAALLHMHSARNVGVPALLGQRDLSCAPAAELLTHFPWQHTRGLQQSYTYDSQNRLQYIPANGALITSDDFQQAFQTAIGNTAVTGMVLTPAGSYQVLSPVLP